MVTPIYSYRLKRALEDLLADGVVLTSTPVPGGGTPLYFLRKKPFYETGALTYFDVYFDSDIFNFFMKESILVFDKSERVDPPTATLRYKYFYYMSNLGKEIAKIYLELKEEPTTDKKTRKKALKKAKNLAEKFNNQIYNTSSTTTLTTSSNGTITTTTTYRKKSKFDKSEIKIEDILIRPKRNPTIREEII